MQLVVFVPVSLNAAGCCTNDFTVTIPTVVLSATNPDTGQTISFQGGNGIVLRLKWNQDLATLNGDCEWGNTVSPLPQQFCGDIATVSPASNITGPDQGNQGCPAAAATHPTGHRVPCPTRLIRSHTSQDPVF